MENKKFERTPVRLFHKYPINIKIKNRKFERTQYTEGVTAIKETSLTYSIGNSDGRFVQSGT